MTEIKKLVVVSMFLAAAFSAAAQDIKTVSGKVYEQASQMALEFATVALRQADSTVVAGGMTTNDGSYSLSAPSGTYTLEVSMVGFQSQSIQVTLPANKIFYLEEDKEMLAAASVTGRQKLVEMKLDKLVMNVGQSAFSQGSNALELIKKAPGVTIDKDGNVMLNGKQVSVWIDGRPSYLDGESLRALLRSTSGESVDKFELMEHPSAKYDAAGQGGIINIKTKRNFASGFNGSLGFDGGGMYFGEDVDAFLSNASGWANLAYRGKKTNTFLNMYGGDYNNAVYFSTDTRQELPGASSFVLNTESIQRFNFRNYQIKLGNDWFIDPKNTFGVIFTLPGNSQRSSSDPSTNTSVTSIGGVPIEKANSTIDNISRDMRLTGNLNYTHIFDEARSAELTANLDWYRSGSMSDSKLFNDIWSAATGETGRTDKLIISDNMVNIYSAKLDYQTILWKMAMLEAGAKWATSITDNDTRRTETGIDAVNTLFTYTENIGAVYASLAGQFGKWTLKAGLRGEYTKSLGDWKSIGDRTDRHYFDLFPTVYVGFNPSEKMRYSLSYTRRIQRPSYFILDPVEQYLDAHTYTLGNPDILPEYSDGISFSTGFGRFLNLSLGADFASKVMTQVPELLPNGDQLLKWDNFGKANDAYAVLGATSVPVFKWLDWTAQLTGLYMHSVSAMQDYNADSFTFQGYTCLSFKLPKDWKIDWDGRYTSGMKYTYMELQPQWQSDIAAKKQLLGGKMTLTLKLDDIFRSNSQNIKMHTLGNAESFLVQKYCNQSAQVGLSWNFGHAHQTRVRKVGDLEEASRVGSGGGSGIGK
ncbi:MAG: TonB-dependent receptor [Bacteroidales bacterium]|nr:TonB-dependent receptor [Bacteroidales bacterium]